MCLLVMFGSCVVIVSDGVRSRTISSKCDMKYIHTEHSQNMLSHTHLTFSLPLQDLDDIGGVGTHRHSFYFSHFDLNLFISQSPFNNYFHSIYIDPILTIGSRNQPTDVTETA